MATGKESNDGNRFIEDSSVIRQNPDCKVKKSSLNQPTVLSVPTFTTNTLGNNFPNKSAIDLSRKVLPMTSNPETTASLDKKVLQQGLDLGSKNLSETRKNSCSNLSGFAAGSCASSSAFTSGRHDHRSYQQDYKLFPSPAHKNTVTDRSKITSVPGAELSDKKLVSNLCYSGSRTLSDNESLTFTTGQRSKDKVIASTLFGVVSNLNTCVKSETGQTSGISANVSDYKSAHPIGSRKVTENVITYHEPMFQSVANTLFENQKNLMMGKRKAEEEKMREDGTFQESKKIKLETNTSPNKGVENKTTVVKKKSIENIIERIRTEKTQSRGGCSTQMLKQNVEDTEKSDASRTLCENDKTETIKVQSDLVQLKEPEKSETDLQKSVEANSSQKDDTTKSSEKDDVKHNTNIDLKVKKFELEGNTADKADIKQSLPAEHMAKKTTDSPVKQKKVNSPPKLKKEKSPVKVEKSPVKMKTPESSPSRSKKNDITPSKQKKIDAQLSKEKKQENVSSKKSVESASGISLKNDDISSKQKESAPKQRDIGPSKQINSSSQKESNLPKQKVGSSPKQKDNNSLKKGNNSVKQKENDSQKLKECASSNEEESNSSAIKENSSPKQKKAVQNKNKNEKEFEDQSVENIGKKADGGVCEKSVMKQKKCEDKANVKVKKPTMKKDAKEKMKKQDKNFADTIKEKNIEIIKKTIGEKVKVKYKKLKVDADKPSEEPKKRGRKKKEVTQAASKSSKEGKVITVTKSAGRKQCAIKTNSNLKTKVTKQRKQKLPIAHRRVKREASLNATMFLNILNEKSPRTSKLDPQRSKSDSDIKNFKALSVNTSLSLNNVALNENNDKVDSKQTFLIPTGLKSPKKEKVSPVKQFYGKSSSLGKLTDHNDFVTPKKEPKSPVRTPSPKRKVSFSDDVFEDVFEAVIQRSIEETKEFKVPGKVSSSRKNSKRSESCDKGKGKKDNLKKKDKKGSLKIKSDKKEKKFRLKKIKQAIKMTASKSPEEVAEKKRKANLARLERAKELMKTERKVSEKGVVEEKDSDDLMSDVSEKDDSDSLDQIEPETDKIDEVKKVKAKKGALCRSARTHVSVESKTVVENTMPSPRWCECCQSSYYPYQTTQGTQVWRIKHLVDKDSSKSPEPIQSSSNHFIAAHARCEVRPYASPSHVSMIESNPYVGQIMPHGHIQCSACSCGHSGVFHPGQCQNCTLGGVSNMLPCQRYGGTYSVTYPHTHGSYTHCGCGACYTAGSYHHSVGQTLIHQPQMSMSTESPILLHHPVQLQVTHETSHPVTMSTIPHSHTDSCLTHSSVQTVPLQLSQNEQNLDNLTHMCQLSQGEVTNVSAMASSSPSDHEIDVGSRDDIVKSVPNVSQSSSNASKNINKGLKAARIKKICSKQPVVKLKRSKSCDIAVKATGKVKESLKIKDIIDLKVKDKKKSNLLLIKQKQKQLEQKSVKLSQKKDLKRSISDNDSSASSKKVKLKLGEGKVAKKDKIKRSVSLEQKKEEKQVKEQPKRAWHGWSWEGEGVMKKVTNIFDGQIVQRKCYNAIRHDDGDIIQVKDCVLVCSGQKEKDIPYIAKVSNFWQDSVSDEMMMSVLWFYRPEHAEGGPIYGSLENEVFAAKHRDETLVACIEDRGYVLTFNEYCRFIAEVERSKSNLPARKKVVPEPEEKYPSNRIPPVDVNPENVFLCRHVYDIKLKRVLKNPS